MKKKLFLILQSVLCAALALWLSAGALEIYREGAARKAADPLSWIYTPEAVAAALRPVLPLLLIVLVLTAAGLILGVRDEGAERPVKDSAYRRDRAAAPAASVRWLRPVLLLLALALIAAGVLNGSARDVFGKAVKICTECVGLG